MMKNSSVELAALLVTGCFCFKNRALPSGITFEVLFVPNFEAAIYTAGELGGSRNPRLRYVSMTASDRLLLQQASDLIGLSAEEFGVFAFPTYFLPCYLGISSAREYLSFIEALKQAMQSGCFDSFLQRYPVDFTDMFMRCHQRFFFQSREDWRQHTAPLLADYFAVLDVFSRYIAEYEQQIWPEHRRMLERRASALSHRFLSGGILTRWEHLLNRSVDGCLQFYLCRYNSYWLDATSVSFYQNVLDGEGDDNLVLEYVSHQVGAQLLHAAAWLGEELQQVREQHPEVFYAAYESLVMFFNQKVLDRGLTYDLDYYQGDEFVSLYNQIWYPQLSEVDMLRYAVEQMAPRWNLS
ncbi:hypothetical protein [Alistipes sp. ZOR0009]|uniref:hypothetical protein n=1 Tax=Alistipes sp. ZOR0009 TaxID=1339253 RepID=UPI0012E05164|nr:hypothetical protein [Alistipes sp. ZOR0009]